jgi:hypothetical protein
MGNLGRGASSTLKNRPPWRTVGKPTIKLGGRQGKGGYKPSRKQKKKNNKTKKSRKSVTRRKY